MRLWREVYHQDPRGVELRRVLAHLTCLKVEDEWLEEKHHGRP